jgi:hypothetical protein
MPWHEGQSACCHTPIEWIAVARLPPLATAPSLAVCVAPFHFLRVSHSLLPPLNTPHSRSQHELWNDNARPTLNKQTATMVRALA